MVDLSKVFCRLPGRVSYESVSYTMLYHEYSARILDLAKKNASPSRELAQILEARHLGCAPWG